MLFDEVGSHDLPASYLNELRAAGVDIRPFNTRQGDANRFQLNFRNHRKIVVVDGQPLSLADTMSAMSISAGNAKIGPWRDTHVKAQGPVVQCVQIAWIEDWNWATRTRPSLNWKPAPAPGGADIRPRLLPALGACG